MADKKMYETKHRGELISYFAEHKNECMTAREIISGSGLSLGEATVYRLLAKLTDEGRLKKFIDDNTAGAKYQYSEESCVYHYHLRCLRCGDTICADGVLMGELGKQIARDYGFAVDNSKTVIYGLCKNCR